MAAIIRTEREMNQEQFAEMAGVSVGLIKNIENDRPTGFGTLAAVYRDGVKKRPLTDLEWVQLLIYWSVHHSGTGGRELEKSEVARLHGETLRANLQTAQNLAEVAKELRTGEQALLLKIAEKLREPVFAAAISAVVSLSDSKTDG